ncbi:MAG: EAL domain-containing protein [Caulobacter sp.]
MFIRALETRGVQRIGWHFLTALAAGAAIWCTHFVAILGFDAGAPVDFDPVLTMASLGIAVAGGAVGFAIAGAGRKGFTPAIGGAVAGLGIAAMHYVGMLAYRVQGIVSWDQTYLIVSILAAVVAPSVTLQLAARSPSPRPNLIAAGLAIGVLSLHFTGMAALRVTPLLVDGAFSNPEALLVLALAVACVALIIVAAGLASYLIDNNSRAEAVERLRRMALSDALTTLPNRASFNERLDLEIELAQKLNGAFALVGIDLDRFKEVNDLRGHAAGDELLRILGRRLKALLKTEQAEFIARTGGDEFFAICRLDDPAQVSEFTARLETAFSKIIRIADFEIAPGASFGVAMWPADASDKEALINNADLAMYRAKADPMRSVCFYEPAMDEQIRTRRALAADLREALTRNELSLHYQVQTSITTGRISGYEALLRWDHPQLGFVPPTQFIPIAEENGLILPIGEWVLKRACQEAATWNPPYKVSVNLSAVQFANTDLPRLVLEALLDTNLPPERLELELTESTIFADRARALHMLRQIKALGVSIALDDFGTGYSSLDTLHSFPFDRIKIDRSFFGQETSPRTTAIIRAVLALGKSFGIPVLAEGIETYEQLSLLNAEGCDEAQGFLLGQPAPLDAIVGSGQITRAAPPSTLPQPARAVALTSLSDAEPAPLSRRARRRGASNRNFQ